MLPLAKPAARQPRKWTVAEDQKLREEVEAQSKSIHSNYHPPLPLAIQPGRLSCQRCLAEYLKG